MKIFNLLTLTFGLMLGVITGLQAQCQVNFSWSPNGNNITFVATTSGTNPSSTYYVWDYGDNSLGYNGPTALHSYNSPGLYLVCLTVQDSFSGCFATYCDSVWVNAGNPCANFNANMGYWVDTTGNNGLVYFYNTTTGGTAPYTYSWSFGDGSGSTLANPSHQYNSPNQLYWACVTVTDANGCTVSSGDTIAPTNPCANQLASFSYNFNPNGLVSFTSSVSGGNPASYYWTFGDGTNSTTANPTHQYSANGSYTVTLYVNFTNGCSRIYSATIGITNLPSCQAAFSSSVNGNAVLLVATTTNMNPSSTTYIWDFGDNNTGTGGPTTQHGYQNAGGYMVCLTVIDNNSGCSVTYCDSIYVGNTNPCANFSATYVYTANGNVVAFNSAVTGGTPGYSYAWNFGDGTSSTLANPTHTYANASSYGVFLVVTDANGCNYTYYDTVTTTVNTCTQNEVMLMVHFDNYAYEVSWDVRNANGTIVASGSGYTPNQNGTTITRVLCLPTGCYTLNMYDSYGDGICCLYGQGSYTMTDMTTNAILASGGAYAYSETTNFCVGGATNPCSNFWSMFQATTSGNVVQFVATSNHPNVQYIWNFGDNTTGTGNTAIHTYTNTTNSGYYIVCLTAIDSNGCQTTYCDSVVVAPAPCNNNTVTLMLNFDNFAYETTWNIKDANGAIVYSGNGYNQSSNGTTIYRNFCLPTGCYTFNIYDSYGDGICCMWGQGSYNLTGASGNVLASGGAFTYSESTNFCVGGASNPCQYFTNNTFTYTVNPNGVATFTPHFGIQSPFNVSWDFGNGTTSTQWNPTVTYATSGYYVVCMTADSANCVTTYCDTIMVQGGGNPNGAPCAGLNAQINMFQDSVNPFIIWMQPVVNNAAPNAQFTFVWDFGDNTGAFSGSPSHQYTSFGSFVVCLMAFDNTNNCVATICDTITIDSSGNFSRNLDYKDVKPGMLVNTLPPVINFGTAVNAIKNETIALDLYPNPASTSINLVINSKESLNGTISILDIAGKTIQQQNINVAAGQQQVNLSVNNLAAGVYLVKVAGDTVQQTMKFIKE